MPNAAPIGIFDSGIGGLTLAHAITELMPHEHIVYFGDTAHLPYGDKSPEAIKYYSLKIGQFFDVASIKQMVEQKDNLDELINISQMNFQKMNDYLQKQNRGKVSVAMILGGWVETLYLSAKVATLEKNNEALFENVSEQKFSLETIQLLLGLYASDKYFKIFKEEFQPLFTAYENVEVIFTQGEITYSEDAEGNMVAEDSSTSEIVFTKKDLEKITKAVSNLRKKLIEIE